MALPIASIPILTGEVSQFKNSPFLVGLYCNTEVCSIEFAVLPKFSYLKNTKIPKFVVLKFAYLPKFAYLCTIKSMR